MFDLKECEFWMCNRYQSMKHLRTQRKCLQRNNAIIPNACYRRMKISDIYDTCCDIHVVRLLEYLGEDEWYRDKWYDVLTNMRGDRSDDIELTCRCKYIEQRKSYFATSESNRIRYLLTIYLYSGYCRRYEPEVIIDDTVYILGAYTHPVKWTLFNFFDHIIDLTHRDSRCSLPEILCRRIIGYELARWKSKNNILRDCIYVLWCLYHRSLDREWDSTHICNGSSTHIFTILSDRRKPQKNRVKWLYTIDSCTYSMWTDIYSQKALIVVYMWEMKSHDYWGIALSHWETSISHQNICIFLWKAINLSVIFAKKR